MEVEYLDLQDLQDWNIIGCYFTKKSNKDYTIMKNIFYFRLRFDYVIFNKKNVYIFSNEKKLNEFRDCIHMITNFINCKDHILASPQPDGINKIYLVNNIKYCN